MLLCVIMRESSWYQLPALVFNAPEPQFATLSSSIPRLRLHYFIPSTPLLNHPSPGRHPPTSIQELTRKNYYISPLHTLFLTF